VSVNVIFFAKLTAIFWCFILVLADKLKTNAKTQKEETKITWEREKRGKSWGRLNFAYAIREYMDSTML